MNEKVKADIGEIIRVGLILFAITAVSAVLLAFVNGKTAPLIEANALAKEQDAMRAVMPDAADFREEDVSALPVEGDGEITKAFTALDQSGRVIGACVITDTTGYDIGIQTVTGVDTELKVTGIDIIAMNETPGLGAKASEESFRDQYRNKSYRIGVSKSAQTETDIQAISGATKTSNGVTGGVNIALNAASVLLEGGIE